MAVSSRFTLLALIAGLLFLSLAAEIPRKRLAGPPSEFKTHVVPNPEDSKIVERSITQNIYLQRIEGGNDFGANSTIPVDGPAEFFFTFSSPYAKYIKLEMTDPRGNRIDLSKAEIKSSFPLGVGNNIPTQGYFVLNSHKGDYVLVMIAKNLPPKEIKKIEDSVVPQAIVTLINNDNLVIESYLSTYEIAVGKTIGVNAKIVADSSAAQPLTVSVSAANLNIMTPSGTDISVPMNDEGRDGDVFANDGVYGGSLQIHSPGQYVIQPILAGSFDSIGAESSTQFVRSTQHLVSVSGVSLNVTGKAVLEKLDAQRMLINISVSSLNPADNLRAYAEVWGKKGDTLVPVAWIGGLVSIESGIVSLELNALWLQRAGVSGSLVLRNVYIADIMTSFPIASFAGDIPVGNSATIPIPGFSLMLQKEPVPITYEMRNGVNPRPLNKTAAAGKKGLVLVPGYCASINPWSRNSGDFTNAYFFSEMNLNLPNDAYAKKVIAFTEQQGLESFGLIGHSQGGVVAAHIHNYYFSGLESATGPRPIQSVGTPYQGSTAAANAADLGKSFGVGCGANSDLSRDGAVNWLAGISSDARKDVYFFTTTYKRNTFFGDYCSAPMNSILQWPNDGVTELKYAPLDGGNNMGNKDKFCHTVDMAYPAQYDDKDRNKDMNANAAR